MIATAVGQYQTVCLTTLEYAVKGSLVSTSCPSCGLRLIIKNDSLANRVVSVSLLLGMSLIIGYHLGSHGHGWISHLSSKVLRALGFRRDKGSPSRQGRLGSSSARGRPDGQPTEFNHPSSSLQKKKYSGQGNGYQRQLSINNNNSSDEELMYEDEMETRMSDLHSSDSAIDVNYNDLVSEDDIDEQLMEIFNYDHLYEELYSCKSPTTNSVNSQTASKNVDGDDKVRRGRFGTGTVDRIDQVLQQVDDIKRSIVEIDDELYQIAGATYANFNPNFLSLTSVANIEEEFADLLFDDENPAPSSPNRAVTEDKNRHSRQSTSSTSASEQHLDSVNSDKQRLLLRRRAKTTTTSGEQQTDSDSQSHASLSSLDLDGSGLQLEWDFDFESGNYDYYDSNKAASAKAQTESSSKQTLEEQTPRQQGSASPLKEKLSSAATGLELPMTDEQKLKNMHDLLDEAKRLGLLNNIIDALAPSKVVQKGEEKDKKATNMKSF